MREQDEEERDYFRELALGDECPAYMTDPEPPASLVLRWNGLRKQEPEATSTESPDSQS
jgi:hypothetical protein